MKIIALFSNCINEIKKTPWLKRCLALALCVAFIGCASLTAVFTVSYAMKASVQDLVVSDYEESMPEGVDLILVLGAGLRSDGSPSDMLADRLRVGVSLFEFDCSDIILMSGDDSGKEYNEVSAMKRFAQDLGVNAENILVDGRGFSTYESISRAVEEYGAERIVIVTQEYHLYRALYIARTLGIEAVGVPSDLRTYRGQWYRDLREHLARFKDFFLTLEKD